MKNTVDKEVDFYGWSDRQHEIALDNTVQHWGESVLPLLYDDACEDIADRQGLFKYLMTAVERGDIATARMIQKHEHEMAESMRGWDDVLNPLPDDYRQEWIQQRFLVLLAIYRARNAS